MGGDRRFRQHHEVWSGWRGLPAPVSRYTAALGGKLALRRACSDTLGLAHGRYCGERQLAVSGLKVRILHEITLVIKHHVSFKYMRSVLSIC